MTYRIVDTRSRVRLTPADWARVEALATAESRSVSNMLGVLVAEAMAARALDRRLQEHHIEAGVRESYPAITRPERAQKGATK